MNRFEEPKIKRRRDGSIDTAHYMKIGRQERSEQAHKLARLMMPKRGPFSVKFWKLRMPGV